MPKITFVDPNKDLERFIPQITKTIEDSLAALQSVVDIPECEIIVTDRKDLAIPETGVGGYAPDGKELYIHINPDSDYFKSHVNEEICSTLVHEMHHVLRWKTVGYGNTLLEAMISEGLADHFDIEINATEPKPWSVALTEEEVIKMLEKARPHFDDDLYENWMFGDETISRWTGYSLGFYIVKNYLEKTGKRPSELISLPASQFAA